ncbi:MAG: hypothetical protein NZ699_00810 [Roseiflexus sp.]|nr:hypothetical protein [Roseiflexus sp.]MDW8147846.1 hypothetical protein [Roseiflexaceae bacterium]MDW8233719.1 hypothetical protein [Roseiflexaceae bacterium]
MPGNVTRSSPFGLVSGIPQQKSDLTLVVTPANPFAPEARKGQLHIVVEADQDVSRGRDACSLVLRTIRRVFYEDPSFSVTSSLRKAILAANRALYQQNFNAPPQKRAVVGLTCAVIKDRDLFIAQVAPAQAYVMAEGRLRALPANAEWGGTAIPFRSRALGASLSIEPDLYRAVLRPGDGILICTSNLSDLLSREEVTRLLRAAEPEDAVASITELCRHHQITDAHGIVAMTFARLSPAAQASPFSAAGINERARLALGGVAERLARAGADIVWLLRGPAEREARKRAKAHRARQMEEEQRLTRPYNEPPYSANPLPVPPPLRLGEPPTGGPNHRSSSVAQSPPEMPFAPSTLLGEVSFRDTPAPERVIDLSDTPGQAVFSRYTQMKRPGAHPFSRPYEDRAHLFTRLSGKIMRLLQPRPSAPPRALPRQYRSTGLSYRRQSPPFPWLLLLLLVSLVTLLILYGTTLSREQALREADNALTEAEQAVAAIRNAPDEATAQERLIEAEESLAALRSSDLITATAAHRQRYEELVREYTRALAAVQKQTYFEDLTEVTRHPLPGGLFDVVIVPPPPRTVTDTISFGFIYMLDTNAGTLYRAPRTGGSAQPFLRPEDVVGQMSVGRVRAAAWRIDNIVAVAQSGDSGPFVFYFRNGNEWRYTILAGSEEWGRVGERFRAVNYEGNLYVLGAVRNNVLRYLSGEYGSFPLPWIQHDGGRDVGSAIDLAVDGKINLLMPDGRVLIFATNSAGERAFEREIPVPQIRPPLVTATRFFVTGPPDSGSIFLVDSFNGRIVQIDKLTGEFIQQISAPPDGPITLDQLFSVFVDESGSRPALYMVNGGQVVRGLLPDRPRPFHHPTAPTPTIAP